MRSELDEQLTDRFGRDRVLIHDRDDFFGQRVHRPQHIEPVPSRWSGNTIADKTPHEPEECAMDEVCRIYKKRVRLPARTSSSRGVNCSVRKASCAAALSGFVA